MFSGGYELLIVAAIFLLLFGGSRLPSLMRSMGRSVTEFKQGLRDEPEAKALEDKKETEEEEVAS